MSYPYDIHRKEIIILLESARKNDPWTRDRIAAKLNIPHSTPSEKNGLKRYIEYLKANAEPGSTLSLVGNLGKGYYYPVFDDEARELEKRRKKVGVGFLKSAQKYAAYSKVAIRRQLTLEDFGGDGNK